MRERRHEIERQLAAYYDAESMVRAGRATAAIRVAARERAVAGVLAPVRGRLLDLGSGPGTDTAALRAAGHEVVALDLSVVNARVAGGPAVAASAVELPFAPSSFAGAWSMSALMHVPVGSVPAALAELARVVQPGGPVVLGTWGGPDEEETILNEAIGLPRLFSRRSDEVWRSLLIRWLGEIERFETWPDVGVEGWHYQWVEVRVSR